MSVIWLIFLSSLLISRCRSFFLRSHSFVHARVIMLVLFPSCRSTGDFIWLLFGSPLFGVTGKACLSLTCCNTQWNVRCTVSASKTVGIYICALRPVIFISLPLSRHAFPGDAGEYLSTCFGAVCPFFQWLVILQPMSATQLDAWYEKM